MRLAILDDYQNVACNLADWTSGLPGVDVMFFHDHPDEATLVERLQDIEMIVAMRERTAFPAHVLARLPRLQLLVTTGMRNAAIDVAAASNAGVTVCGTEGYSWSAAELTWGLIIASTRNIPAEDAAIRRGGWQHTIGFDLGGKTLGLIGLGHLGARVARYGHAFDMNVIAWSPNLTEEMAAEHDVAYVSRDVLFTTSDVISIHLVLGKRTRGLITENDLRRMKSTSHLINTSRGAIVEEAALVRALREAWIAGAGLDVYESEPLPAESPLRSLPRTVLTPHIGYVTHEVYSRFYADALADVQGFLRGEPVRQLSR